MAADIANVAVAVSGSVYKAPLGTTAPTGVTAFSSPWVDLGFLSDDGFTEANDVDTDDVNAWQNGTLVRRIITGQSTTFEFTCIESTDAVLELRHPGSTMASGAMEVKALTSGLYFALGFDVVDGTNHIRIIAPKCEVTDFDDIEYTSGDPIGYHVTCTAYADADGTVLYKYYSALD